MVFKPDPPALLPACMARIHLFAAHRAYLNALPGAGHLIGSSLGCELQQGHEALHLAEGQSAGTTGHLNEPLWIEFQTHDAYQTMRFAPYCQAESGDSEEYENAPCLIIERHSGGHSWQLHRGPAR